MTSADARKARDSAESEGCLILFLSFVGGIVLTIILALLTTSGLFNRWERLQAAPAPVDKAGSPRASGPG